MRSMTRGASFQTWDWVRRSVSHPWEGRLEKQAWPLPNFNFFSLGGTAPPRDLCPTGLGLGAALGPPAVRLGLRDESQAPPVLSPLPSPPSGNGITMWEKLKTGSGGRGGGPRRHAGTFASIGWAWRSARLPGQGTVRGRAGPGTALGPRDNIADNVGG